jgi:RNA polymerase-interacting CarD/CdnL/TRCF family regulator
LTLTLLEVDLSNVIRNLISAEEALELLDQLKGWEVKVSGQWKARADAHQAAIDGGDPFEYAKVVKGLMHMEEGGTLRPGDRAHLNKSLGLLTAELAFALKKSRSQVSKMIDQAVK